MKDTTGPAFPNHPIPGEVIGSPGMTYRQWLIGMALSGLCASEASNLKCIAEDCVRLADAVIEAEGK